MHRAGGPTPGKLRKACRDIYRQAPTKAEAEELGLTLEEATPVVEIWPDNLDSINTFVSMLTQWRVGPNGAVGLDYGVLPAVLRLNGIEEDRHQALFSDVRVLEDEALRTIRGKK